MQPFDGDLDPLLVRHRIVVVETYPAEFYRHLDVDFRGGSKRRQEDRRRNAAALARWAIEDARADIDATAQLTGATAAVMEQAAWVEYYGRDYRHAAEHVR